MPKFEDHKELIPCGDCPFLKTEKGEDFHDCGCSSGSSGSCGCYSYKIDDPKKVMNICRVEQYNFGYDLKMSSLGKGQNPERHKGCLRLARHIHNQMANAVKA